MSTDVIDIGTVPAAWTRRHLLDLESLSAEEITTILDTAVAFKEATAGCQQKFRLLVRQDLREFVLREFDPHRAPAFRWPPGGWGPTRSISPPPAPACRKARRSSTRAETSKRWGSTWSSCGIARPARPNCWPKISIAR